MTIRTGPGGRARRLAFAGTALVAATLIGYGAVASASAGDDVDTPIEGEELDRATAAALAHLGGGTVTDTEVGDEDSWYEVEVTLDDGSQVDVQLDRAFAVVGTESDGPDDR